jgi:hypothetical protein
VSNDLEAVARRVGANRWMEIRLFEILGTWVPTVSEARVKVLLDRHSLHHAWRAQQWWDRLPVVAGIDRPGLVAPPSATVELLLDHLAALEDSAARLAGAYRVAIPRLAGTYETQVQQLSPVADSSVLRTMHIVRADLESDWREGEFTLQALLVDAEAVGVAAGAVAGLESIVAEQEAVWGVEHPL